MSDSQSRCTKEIKKVEKIAVMLTKTVKKNIASGQQVKRSSDF